jgi:hypothetical protein
MSLAVDTAGNLYNKRGMLADEFQRLKNDVRCPVPPATLEAIEQPAVGKKRQPLRGYRWAAGIAKQPCQELGIHPDGPEAIFLNHWGRALTRFGVRLILRKHVRKAASNMPSLKQKRLHPHSLTDLPPAF